MGERGALTLYPKAEESRVRRGGKLLRPPDFSGGVARQRHGRGIHRHRYFVPRNRLVVRRSPEITTGSPPGGCSGPQPVESMAEEPRICGDRGWRDCVRWQDPLGKKRLSSGAHMTLTDAHIQGGVGLTTGSHHASTAHARPGYWG
jgi:DNA-binding transcriptional LysR family regulator